LSFSKRTSNFFMKSLLTNLSFLSLSTSSLSRSTYLAISLIIYELIQLISTCNLAISSMLDTKNAIHSLTRRSILRKSADISIDTTFFKSSVGILADAATAESSSHF
jgi:hypothetical protein